MCPGEPPGYGTFTLHGTGTGTGTGDGTRINGFLYIMFTVHTALRQGQEPDPLSPIVLVPFPVPVPVLVPCSVNKPLGLSGVPLPLLQIEPREPPGGQTKFALWIFSFTRQKHQYRILELTREWEYEPGADPQHWFLLISINFQNTCFWK